MRHFILCFGLMMSSGLLLAQTFDAVKMNKDIEITEKMLESLTKETFGDFMNWEETVEGTYIEDFGVIFTIRTTANVYAVEGLRIRRPGIAIKGLPSIKTISIENARSNDSSSITSVIKKKEIATAFLGNYATLIRQMKPQDRILLNFIDDFEQHFAFEWENGRPVVQYNQTTLTAEISNRDIEDFNTKKINEEAFVSRIKFKEASDDNISAPDVDRLITIFEQLHSGDNPDKKLTLIVNNQYSYIENLGVVITFDLHDNQEYPGFDMDDENNEQKMKDFEAKRQQTLKDNLNVFLKAFKEDVVEYGRTVKSIQPTEMLIFKLQTHLFEENQVEISVKRSVLDDYEQRKITLAQAVEKVKVTNNFQK